MSTIVGVANGPYDDLEMAVIVGLIVVLYWEYSLKFDIPVRGACIANSSGQRQADRQWHIRFLGEMKTNFLDDPRFQFVDRNIRPRD